MGQRVERKQRLKVNLLLRFPDINTNKSYSAIERKYIVKVDNEPMGIVDMTTVPKLFLNDIRVRSKIVVEKRYDKKMPDSIFEYRVGENFAILTNQNGRQKRMALDFEDANILDIKDDQDFNSIKDISRL